MEIQSITPFPDLTYYFKIDFGFLVHDNDKCGDFFRSLAGSPENYPPEHLTPNEKIRGILRFVQTRLEHKLPDHLVPELANGGTQNIPILGDVDINENGEKSERIIWQLSHQPLNDYPPYHVVDELDPGKFIANLPTFKAGVTLTSPPLRFTMRWASAILETLKQLRADLAYNGDYGSYICNHKAPMLSVFVGLADDQLIELDVLKNIVALYGLAQTQIERFVPLLNRWALATRLRVGMERNRLDKIRLEPITNSRKRKASLTEESGRHHSGFVITTAGQFYTHHGFTDNIYATETVSELITEISGCGPQHTYSDGSPRPTAARANIVINFIPGARGNLTTAQFVEFKQFDPTLDPKDLKSWITFCVHLFLHAHYFATIGVAFKDTSLSHCEEGFFDTFSNEETFLDFINLDAEAKAHLKGRQAKEGENSLYFKKLEIDNILIRARNDIRKHARDKAHANDVAAEIEILASLPEVQNNPEELPEDIFNVTFQESWRWTVYLETALCEMKEALGEDYVFREQGADEERLNYLQSEVMPKWVEFSGNPYLRLQRLRQNLFLADDEEIFAAAGAKLAARMEEAMTKHIERQREEVMERGRQEEVERQRERMGDIDIEL